MREEQERIETDYERRTGENRETMREEQEMIERDCGRRTGEDRERL